MTIEGAQRLDRIVQNIRSETAFNDRYSDPVKLSYRMAQLHTPAVSIAVIDDYKIAAVGAYGTHEAGSVRQVNQDTLFLAGSISKSVFATAIMYLVQTGDLDLDEDVNHYLRSWKIPANNGWQPRITLRHLLSHTSGLTVHGFPGYQSNEEIPSLVQILNGESPANTEKVEVNILPGIQFLYSGGGTTVAQLAMIDHLKDTFQSLIQRLVFEPLGMRNSTFESPLPTNMMSTAAIAHPWKNIPLKGEHHIYPESAAAGLWTTASDLATFGLALQDGLRGETTHFLNQTTIETMLSPQLAHQKNKPNYVGLGFFCEEHDKHSVFRHGGWDEGFVAELILSKDEGKGMVVMLNSNEGYPLIDEIKRAVANEFEWPYLYERISTIQLPDLDAYVGKYKSEHPYLFSIEATEDGLLLQYDNQLPVLFKASSEQKFISAILNTELLFEIDSDGVVEGLTIQQNGAHYRAKKY